ncbi:MAG: hypothetical protein IJD98_04300 [Oscillospiraceae bacterium]|nr:hypothetical protein [Oscillospiraceae bacterium]
MTEYQLLMAMNNISSRYLDGAQRKLGYLPQLPAEHPPSRSRRPLRRLLSMAAAVLLMTTVLFMTAFAVSEEFREWVVAFFRVERTEIIPEETSAETSRFGVAQENVDIGGLIRGTYVHTPQASHARNGIYTICTDEIMMNSGNHYDAYILENGEFIRLEEHSFSQTYTLQGAEVSVAMEWAEHNGQVTVTYIDADAPCRIYGMSGGADGMLVELFLPHSYPVILNLRTGELRDVLAGTGAEALQDIGNAALTEDGTKMLLVTWEEKIYCADLVEKKLYDLDELSGEHVESCVVFGDTVTCMVLEDASIEEKQLGSCRAWNMDLKTLERSELFRIPATPASSHDVWSEGISFDQNGNLIEPDEQNWNEIGIHFMEGFDRSIHWGNLYAGSRFAVEVDEQRNVYVIDLHTGEKGLVQGWTWPDIPYPILECQPCPDGKKLLIYSRTSHTCFDTIGVLDFEKKAYFEFERENRKAVQEKLIYWFDYDSIMVTAEGGGMVRDYYLYELTQ